MKKRVIAIMLGVCMLCLSGCGEKKILPFSAEAKIEDIDLPIAVEADQTLEEGVNQFAHSFYEQLDTSQNIFFSPYSICSAISILDVGADGETKEELEAMLGITDLEKWNQQMKLYLEKEWSKETRVLTANSLWIAPYMNKSPNIDKEFVEPALFYYHGELFEADFVGENEKVLAALNKWVDEKTEHMIPKYREKLESDINMIILNAVYFEGKWDAPFLANATQKDGIFTNIDGEKKENIALMRKTNTSFRYIESGNLKGIELPYKNSSVAMDILLPVDDEGYDCISLYNALSAQEKESIWQSFDGAGYKNIQQLAMPKFTMDIQVQGMDGILQSMGMKSAYKQDANLDKIGPDTYVSAVSHRAKIEVDEEGTKAAAITEICTTECAMEITEVINFRMDRPFVYIIRDTETGLILFMGQVTDL